MDRAGVDRAWAPAMYCSLGRSLVETVWLAHRPAVQASAFASVDDALTALLDRAAWNGQGVVLATAHTGNWELAGAVLAERYRLTAVAKTQRVGWVERFCRTARASRRIAVVSPSGAMTEGRRALARGEVVAMLIDQVPDRARHALPVPFLGAVADVDRAPATLAAWARAPLVVAAARRVDGAHRLQLLTALFPPDRPRRAWIDDATREATAALERFVRETPAEWLWMHRRWRHPAP